MSTQYDIKPATGSSPSQPVVNQPSNAQFQAQTHNPKPVVATSLNNPIQNLVNVMQSVDSSSPEAKLNATSMDDNNGGRIEFNEDEMVSNPSNKSSE